MRTPLCEPGRLLPVEILRRFVGEAEATLTQRVSCQRLTPV